MSNKTRFFAPLALCASLLVAAPAANSALIGQWTFEGSNVLADSTGHFSNLQLQGNATISNGALDVNGTGTTATGWAKTTGYSGPAITSKTLVVWVTLQSMSATANAGSAMTIDKVGSDVFDGIIYGENTFNRWMEGSNGGSRNNGGAMGYVETGIGNLLQMAISYQDNGNGTVQITGYRNGVSMGSYLANNAGSWSGTSDTEILFGVRHTYFGNPTGALDAMISEARIYDTALSQAQIQGLSLDGASAPEPESLALLGLALPLLRLRRRKQG